MNRGLHLWRAMLCGVFILGSSTALRAQKSSVVPSRVVETVDDTQTVTLTGNVHPLAKAQFDQGAVPDSQPMTRMLLMLQRSSAQELSLRSLIDAQQTKGSASYHAWLTPTQFGNQFGPSDSDVQAVTDWLSREGFQVKNVAQGKTVIEFDGNAGQVRNAFHTEIHKFVQNGETHVANVSDPAIPEALAPVVAGVAALHNFPKHANIRKSGWYRRAKGSSVLEPLFTFGNPANYALGPGDFAKIYNIPSTATGAGQSIAVMAQTNINTQDIANFRSMFGLSTYSTCTTTTLPPPASCQFAVIINGVDPGIIGPTVVNCANATDDEVESDLDTEWAGAVAPSANIYLVVSQTTCANTSQVSQGVDLSALYAVDNNIAGVISDSYGNCEAALLTAGNQFYNSIWEQAAAQGITVAVSAGDSGSAGCDPIASIDPDAATQGVNVNGLASTPFNVAVGGTDFDPTSTSTAAATYWAPNTSGDVVNSALGYIPETTWDDSACAFAYPAACTSVDTTNGTDIVAASGGPSNCVVATADSNGNISCGKNSSFPNYGYPKPAFQSSLTPADSVRDIPDVSFFASNGGPPSTGAGVAYVICQSDANTPGGASCNLSTPYQDFGLVGGTSASTPAFAAVMALVNQSQASMTNTAPRQGNANYVLYNLALTDSNYTSSKCTSSLGQTPAAGCVFNDVTKGNNSVACDAGSPNCNNTANVSGEYGVVICTPTTGPACPAVDNGQPAFQSVAMYDLATGLGSINVGNLLTKWTSALRTATTTTLSGATGGSNSTSTFTAKVSVSPGAATGDVSLIALSAQSTVLGSFGPFTLSGGTASVTTNILPVGTTSVEATYGGNTTYAVSTSTPVALSATVAGAGYTAKTTLNFVSTTGISTSPQNFPYGTPYSLQIVVSNSSGNSCAFSYPNTKPTIPCPTGTITLTDNGNPLTDFLNNGKATNVTSLNNLGLAEDQPISLPATVGSTTPGVHNIVATYSGDGNYAAGSPSNTLKVTIQQLATTTQVASSLSSITSGATVLLTASITPNSASNGNAPCGTGSTGKVQFTSNGSNLSGTVTYTGTPGSTSPNGASCTATLSTAISSLYPNGRPNSPTIPRIPLLVAALSLLFFVLGLRWIPETRRRAYACIGLLAIGLLVGVVAGCGGGGGGGGGGSTRNIGAAYSGDANYKSSSGSTTISIQ